MAELTISCDREVFLANEKNKEPLITMMDTSPHMLTWPKTKLENGTKIYCGMLDQLRIIEKELQMDILSKCNLRKTIKLGKKHGRRK